MREVFFVLGTSLPTMGPGISALRIFMERLGSFSAMMVTSTRTPMPPTQWVKLRQNRLPRCMASRSVRMKVPVVV